MNETTVFIHNGYYVVREGDTLHIDDMWTTPGTELVYQTFSDVKVYTRVIDNDTVGSNIKITKIEKLAAPEEKPVEEPEKEVVEEVEENTIITPEYEKKTKGELLTFIKDNKLDIDVTKKTKAQLVEELKEKYPTIELKN